MVYDSGSDLVAEGCAFPPKLRALPTPMRVAISGSITRRLGNMLAEKQQQAFVLLQNKATGDPVFH